VDKILKRLKTEFTSEETRYAYADSIANAFLTSQVKRLQEARQLTQDDLAVMIGTKQSGISRWLNTGFSTCEVKTLRKFARAYGVRLWISFREFGSLPEDVRGFTAERLAPSKFEKDPAFAPNARVKRRSTRKKYDGKSFRRLRKKPAVGDFSRIATSLAASQLSVGGARESGVFESARPILSGNNSTGTVKAHFVGNNNSTGARSYGT